MCPLNDTESFRPAKPAKLPLIAVFQGPFFAPVRFMCP